MLREHGLDALVTPSYAPANPIDLVNPESFPGACTGPTAVAGYPLVTVPTELAAGLPVAVSFWGTAGSEAGLIEIAHGYEAGPGLLHRPAPGADVPDLRLRTVRTRRGRRSRARGRGTRRPAPRRPRRR